MDLLPPEDRREWLLDQLAGLIARCGPEPFVAAPLLVPSPRLFPDRWTPDAEGVGRMARRILAYAQIADVRVEISAIMNPERQEPAAPVLGFGTSTFTAGIAGCYAGVEDGVCRLGIDPTLVDEPEALAGVLCHEVAHVWRDRHSLVGADRAEEELATDVTTVYLGFGILTANAAYRYASAGHQVGVYAVTQWSHRASGYLPPESMCFLLAAQVLVLGEDDRQVRKWLSPTQADSFRAACDWLDPDGVAERLGLPPRDSWPAPREVDSAPFME